MNGMSVRKMELESEVGRLKIGIPAFLLSNTPAWTRFRTAGFRIMCDEEISGSVFRHACEMVNKHLHRHRSDVKEENTWIGLSTFVEYIKNDEVNLTEAQEQESAAIMALANLAPSGLPVKGQTLPEQYRSNWKENAANTAVVTPPDCGLEKTHQKDLNCTAYLLPEGSTSAEGRSDIDPSRFPDLAVWNGRPQRRRRDSRACVSEDESDRIVEQYMSWRVREMGCQYSWILHPFSYEAKPSECVYLFIDGDVVFQQDGHHHRPKKAVRPAKRTNINIIDAVVATETGYFPITDATKEGAMRQVIACMIKNDLLGRKIIVIMDGEDTLHKCVDHYLMPWDHVVYLDWYHFLHKLGEKLSSAIISRRVDDPWAEQVLYKKGRHKGQPKPKKKTSLSVMYLRELSVLAWVGNFPELLERLVSIPDEDLKTNGREMLKGIVTYVVNKQSMLTCYAIRKVLGLINSSNMVEKLNDVIVSDREKQDGMFWRPDGANGLAQIENFYHSDRLENYLQTGKISFDLLPYRSKKVEAA